MSLTGDDYLMSALLERSFLTCLDLFFMSRLSSSNANTIVLDRQSEPILEIVHMHWTENDKTRGVLLAENMNMHLLRDVPRVLIFSFWKLENSSVYVGPRSCK
jgi:hypothetical protein